MVSRRFVLQAIAAGAGALLSGCGAKGPTQGAGGAATDASLVATFLNVGKADAIVLQSQGACVMVDTGTAASASSVVGELEGLGVGSIDALILTHFDQDHVGGAAALLRAFEVGEVYVTFQSKLSEEVEAYEAAMGERGLVAEELSRASTLDLTLGGMELRIIAPESDDYGDNDTSNDSSLVTKVSCDGASMLLTGDIERRRIKELLASDEDLSCNLLKMPHHGGHEKNTDDLIAACQPTYAVITSSDAEREDAETLEVLEQAGVTYFLTREGSVTATLTSDPGAEPIWHVSH